MGVWRPSIKLEGRAWSRLPLQRSTKLFVCYRSTSWYQVHQCMPVWRAWQTWPGWQRARATGRIPYRTEDEHVTYHRYGAGANTVRRTYMSPVTQGLEILLYLVPGTTTTPVLPVKYMIRTEYGT